MKLLGALALAALSLSAQTAAPGLPAPVLTFSATGGVYPGATINFSLNIANTAGWNISALAFGNWPGAQNVQPGQAAVDAVKTLTCAGQTCLLAGITNAAQPALSNAVLQDGPVLTFSYTVSDTAQIGSTVSVAVAATNLPLAADVGGNAVAITATPLNLTVQASPNCIGAVQTLITGFLAAPTQPVLGQIVNTIVATLVGTCH